MVHFTPYFTVPGCGYSAKSLPIGTNLYTCLSPLCCVVHFGAVLIIRPHLVTNTTWAVFHHTSSLCGLPWATLFIIAQFLQYCTADLNEACVSAFLSHSTVCSAE